MGIKLGILIGVVIGIAVLAASPSLLQQIQTISSNSDTNPTQSTSTPEIESNSSSNINPNSINYIQQYVTIDCKSLGWFYSTPRGTSFNYTYLVVNVTITNNGHSIITIPNPNAYGVQVIGDKLCAAGFKVGIGGGPGKGNPQLYKQVNVSGHGFVTNTGVIQTIYNPASYVSFSPYNTMSAGKRLNIVMPTTSIQPIKLAFTGSYKETIFFEFGDPAIIPTQPQIINEPFQLLFDINGGSINVTP
jgi:hypothetical protein